MLRYLSLLSVVLLVACLFATPAMAQGTFDYPSSTQVIFVGTGTITVFALPAGLVTLNCPSTGVMGLFCAEVAPGDMAGFEGTLPSTLEVVEIDRGGGIPAITWDIPSGCIDGISTLGAYTIFDVDEGNGTNTDVYCDAAGMLGTICDELQVNDCTQFQGTIFPSDSDNAGAHWLRAIRAEP